MHDGRHLRALDEYLIDIRGAGEQGNATLFILGGRVVELRLEGIELRRGGIHHGAGPTGLGSHRLLAKRELDRGRVGLRVALRVAADLEERRVECLDDLAIGVGHLEPLGGILYTGVNHALIKGLDKLLKGTHRLILISPSQREIDGILGGRTRRLVKDIDTVGDIEAGRLDNEAAGLIAHIDSLAAIVKQLDRAEGDLGGSNIRGSADHAGHRTGA